MLRPGRLETPLFVDLPGPGERVEILRALLRNKPIDNISEIAEIARKCEGYSGADLGALLRQAGQHAISRKVTRLEYQDFEYAGTMIEGSVGKEAMRRFYKLRERFGRRM